MSSDIPLVEVPPAVAPLGQSGTLIGQQRTPVGPAAQDIVDTAPPKKNLTFWLIMFAVSMSTFVSAMDLTAVTTALPTVVNSLQGGENFIWIGSAYGLACTATMPLFGNFATIVGRQISMLAALAIFAVGAAMSGASKGMTLMIAGRTVQGVGAGGIIALTEIIVADLVSLEERGAYMGMLGAVWAFALAVGPPIGGAFAQRGAWRFLFFLNLPLSGLTMVLVLVCMKLKKPPGSIMHKLARVDWSGNGLLITATTIATVALVEGGSVHPWGSYQIVVPLVLGFVGIAAFLVYEARWVREPSVPFDILNNRTSLSGYAGTVVQGFVVAAVLFYLPVYFQGAKIATPVRSSVDMFPFAFLIAPAGILAGASISIFHEYRLQNVIAWVLVTVGSGILSLLTKDSSIGQWVGYQLVMASGLGVLSAATTFPVLAPLPVTKNAHALSFMSFVRSFAQTFGVSVGGTALQNGLLRNLPADFTSLFPAGGNIAYSAIAQIPDIPEPLQSQIREAFAASVSTVWKVLIGVAAVGLISSLFMKQLKLHDTTDQNWGIEERQKRENVAEVGGVITGS